LGAEESKATVHLIIEKFIFPERWEDSRGHEGGDIPGLPKLYRISFAATCV
jgi:hypothetical protein